MYQRKILYTTTKPVKNIFCHMLTQVSCRRSLVCIASCGYMTPPSRHMPSNANCVMSQQLPHYTTLARKKHSVKHSRMIHKSIWAIFKASRKQKGENVLSKYDSCFIHSLAKGSVGGLGGDYCALSVSPEQPSTSQHTHTHRIQNIHSIKHAQSEHRATERGNSISFSIIRLDCRLIWGSRCCQSNAWYFFEKRGMQSTYSTLQIWRA